MTFLHVFLDTLPKDESTAIPIAQDVKFVPIDLAQMTVDKGKKRKIIDKVEDEAKKKAEEEYNDQQREQTYKRLMHLLTKSQFYSSYIIDKINSKETTKSKKKGGRTSSKAKSAQVTDENAEPAENSSSTRPQRTARGNKKYDLTEYVSPYVSCSFFSSQELRPTNLSKRMKFFHAFS